MMYDAILLLGFGGPESPDEVRPFLERVTAGRGIPADRLDEVGRHYVTIGGASPINSLNRVLRNSLSAGLAERGYDIPVVLANRNSPPFVLDVLAELAASGAHRLLALATSAYSSYSSCRQYREDVGVALADHPELDVDVVKVPPFAEFGWFAEATAELLAPVLAEPGRRPFVLFTTHSIPSSMARTSGPEPLWPRPESGEPGMYAAQHLVVAKAALAGATRRAGVEAPPWRLVYQSRSGSPATPWLEPDVNDALAELAADGTTDVVIVPIGFLSDHVEVIWDLDTEAAETARGLGLRLTRVPTVGTHPTLIGGLTDLLQSYLGAESTRVPAPSERCAANCCPAPRRPGAGGDPRPVIEGAFL